MQTLIQIQTPEQLKKFKTWASRNINRSLMESCLGLGNIPRMDSNREWDINKYQANEIIKVMFENTLIMYNELLNAIKSK